MLVPRLSTRPRNRSRGSSFSKRDPGARELEGKILEVRQVRGRTHRDAGAGEDHKAGVALGAEERVGEVASPLTNIERQEPRVNWLGRRVAESE